MASGQVAERGSPQRETHTRGLFAEALAGIGGPQRVLLVGELWDSSPRRGLLQDFTRDMFGQPGGPQCGECPGVQDSLCMQSLRGPLLPERCAHPQPVAGPLERRLRAPLIFALFRLSAVQRPAERRRLREILRDVRQRKGGRRAAVVGVIVLPEDPALPKPVLPAGIPVPPGGTGSPAGPTLSDVPDNGATEPPAGPVPLGARDSPAGSAPLGPPDSPACSAPLVAPACSAPLGAPAGSAPLGAPVGSAPLGPPDSPACSAPLGAPEPILLALLSSVFPPVDAQRPPGDSPLQTAVYLAGDPRSALGVMEAACRALRAVDLVHDVEDELKIPTILKCFPWKRRRKGSSLKAGKNTLGETPPHPEEGIALKTLCKLSNGASEENHTDT